MVATGLRSLLQNSFPGAHDLRSKPGARAPRTGAAHSAQRTAQPRPLGLRIATARSRLSSSSGQVAPAMHAADPPPPGAREWTDAALPLGEERGTLRCCCGGVTDAWCVIGLPDGYGSPQPAHGASPLRAIRRHVRRDSCKSRPFSTPRVRISADEFRG